MKGGTIMCKFFQQIGDTIEGYKNTVLRTEKGKEIFDGMELPTKIEYILNHPSN